MRIMCRELHLSPVSIVLPLIHLNRMCFNECKWLVMAPSAEDSFVIAPGFKRCPGPGADAILMKYISVPKMVINLRNFNLNKQCTLHRVYSSLYLVLHACHMASAL